MRADSGSQCLLGATTFCTVTNSDCHISKFYDQTGNGNDLSTLASSQFPNFAFSTLGSNPVLDLLLNLNTSAISGTFAGKSQPWSIAMVIKAVSHSNFATEFTDSAFHGTFLNNTGSDKVTIYAGTAVDISALDSQFHSLSFRADDSGTGSAYSLDSAAATTGITLGTAAFGTTLEFGIGTGYIAEAGIWATLNNTQLSKSVNDNAATFYGSFPQ